VLRGLFETVKARTCMWWGNIIWVLSRKMEWSQSTPVYFLVGDAKSPPNWIRQIPMPLYSVRERSSNLTIDISLDQRSKEYDQPRCRQRFWAQVERSNRSWTSTFQTAYTSWTKRRA
jgi:hypothetical protein